MAWPTMARLLPGGSGVWQMIACTAGSADSPASRPVISAGPAVSGSRPTWQSTPARAAARSMDRTYQAAPGSSVGSSTASPGTVPAARSPAAAAAAWPAMAAAMARPSTSCVMAGLRDFPECAPERELQAS